ncbi:MAG: prepilin-type N-terminal cleavage/methylation domain-containing protein [Verrucomicrobiaceae bacterium]
MKKFPQTRPSRGFSLVELLTVVVIIVILATLVIGAVNKIKKSQDEKFTRTNRQNIAMHLESYAADNNGIYPVGENVLSMPVYQALSGDFTGRLEGEPEGEIYWPELLKEKSNLIGKYNGQRIIIDGFGESFRYRSAVDIEGNEDPMARNADFDIWSIGPDGLPSDLNVDSNLDNEETVDDIWN